MTSPTACSGGKTRFTGRASAAASCRRGQSRTRTSPFSTAPSRRSNCSRRNQMAVDGRFPRVPVEAGEEPGIRNEIITGPVSDWATDFSHLEPEWSADPYPIQDDLRQRCPIAHTKRFGGGGLPPKYEDVAAVASDTDSFSSRSIIMGNYRPPVDLAPVGGSPPISSDPPFHHDARKPLLGAFPKKQIARQEGATRG